ncbi:flagellar protein FlaG [Bacillaceae bacterium W0354]
MEIKSINHSQLLQSNQDSYTPVRNKSVMKEVVKHTEKMNEKAEKLSKDEAKELVDGLNRFLDPVDSAIKFVFHDKLHEYYITIIDRQTEEVIREIPPKKLLDVYASMAEFMGLIVDEKI